MPHFLIIFGEIIMVAFAVLSGVCVALGCAGSTRTAFRHVTSSDSLDHSHKRIKSTFSNYAVPVVIIMLVNAFAITYGISIIRFGTYWIGILMLIGLALDDIADLAHIKWTSLREYLEIKAFKSKKISDMAKFLVIYAFESSVSLIASVIYAVGIASLL